MRTHNLARRSAVLGFSLVVLSCNEPTDAPVRHTPQGLKPSMSFSDSEGSVWTEWPADSQEADSASFSDAPPNGCPQRIPAVGGEGIKKMGLWYTVTHANGSPIQRKMVFDWPLTYHDYGGLGSPSGQGTNYLICGYTYTQAISLESDWKLTQGVVYAFVLYNVVDGVPVAFGVIVPFRCQGCQATRISPPRKPTAHFEMSTDGPGDPMDAESNTETAYDGGILSIAGAAEVQLDGSYSQPGDAAITNYGWAINASELYQGEFQDLYFEPGDYVVTLTVTDALGSFDEASGSINVGEDGTTDVAGGSGDPDCWDVYSVIYDENTGQIYSEEYLYSFCCGADGNCYET